LIKTIKWNTGSAARRFRLKNKKIKLMSKAASLQAGGPAHKAPSGKINYFKKKFDRDLKIGYNRIMKKIEIDTDQKTLNVDEVMKRVITAVNIATGDDGSKAKEVLANFKQLCLMDRKQYAEQVKHYG
jgi:hypothetical protein